MPSRSCVKLRVMATLRRTSGLMSAPGSGSGCALFSALIAFFFLNPSALDSFLLSFNPARAFLA